MEGELQQSGSRGQGCLWVVLGGLGPELMAVVGGKAGRDDFSLRPSASQLLNALAHRSLMWPRKLRGLLG